MDASRAGIGMGFRSPGLEGPFLINALGLGDEGGKGRLFFDTGSGGPLLGGGGGVLETGGWSGA